MILCKNNIYAGFPDLKSRGKFGGPLPTGRESHEVVEWIFLFPLVPSFDRCMACRLIPREFPEVVLKCREINQSAFSISFATSIDYSFIIAHHVVRMHCVTVLYQTLNCLFRSRFGRGKTHVISMGAGKLNTFFFTNI